MRNKCAVGKWSPFSGNYVLTVLFCHVKQRKNMRRRHAAACFMRGRSYKLDLTGKRDASPTCGRLLQEHNLYVTLGPRYPWTLGCRHPSAVWLFVSDLLMFALFPCLYVGFRVEPLNPFYIGFFGGLWGDRFAAGSKCHVCLGLI